MQTTYLVQRLDQKPKNDFQKKASRVFGGGMIGLKEEAWDLLQEHFDLHYMGAAEYEFGTVGRTLHALVLDHAKLVTFEVTLQRKDVKLNYQRQHGHQMDRRREIATAHKAGVKPKRAKPYKDATFVPKTIYVICRDAHKSRVIETIHELALGKVHTKENHHFDSALDPVSEWDSKTIGWLELDNGFFFFLDKEAFDGTCKLLIGEGP